MRAEPSSLRDGPRRGGRILALVCALAGAPAARAADPQPYVVTIEAGDDRAVEAALRESAALATLRRTAPVSPFALVLRARQDRDALLPVLESFGYYGARIDITVEGRPLDDPSLDGLLDALPEGRDAAVRIGVERGPLYHLREVAVDGELPDDVRDALGLEAGAPAVAADALAARDRLLGALQQRGHAFAALEIPVAWVDEREPVIDLHFPVDAGPVVTIGDVEVRGLERTQARIVRSRLKVQRGERYDPRRIDEARRNLLALGVFSGVTVRLADRPAAAGAEVPLLVQVAERRRHAVRISAEYSTDLGGNAGVTWTDRNLRGNAEQLSVTANAVNLGGSATRTLGYDVHVELLQPDPSRTERALRYSVAAIKQSLQAYDVQSVSLGAQRDQRFSEWWTGSVGLALKRADITQQGQDYQYTLLSLPVAARYDNTRQGNPLLDPLRGMRASVTLTPAESLDRPQRALFTMQGTVAAYFDLRSATATGRTVLALRALAGNAFGASQFSLPPDQRFYGGGSATVRGYRYQSIGPTFADGTPAGGTTIAAVTGEVRQRVGERFGAAAFLDAGQVTASKSPFRGTWRVGFGAGVRWYTPIGPLRFDVAFPVNPPAGADGFQVYIGLGQAF